MKERPILFSSPMVRVILEGRKTQTRRIIKPQYEVSGSIWTSIKTKTWMHQSKIENCESLLKVCPYGQIGDILWVRETWLKTMFRDEEGWFFIYRADCNDYDDYKGEWKSPRFMPKAASRIKLEITDIRVEKVQDISEEDAKAEGVYFYGWDDYHQTDYKNYSYNDKGMCDDWGVQTAKESYETLWESINGKGSWGKNPFVWVIKFKRL